MPSVTARRRLDSGPGVAPATTMDARLVESVALGADKVEVVASDARAVGYAMRPPITQRTSVYDFNEIEINGEAYAAPVLRTCLHDGPGGAVVGVVAGRLITVAPSDIPGWVETPIRTPWGDVVLALRPPTWFGQGSGT